MPTTTLYVHKRDRDTLLRMPMVAAGFPLHSQFTYTLDAVAALHSRGITWDGANLWVCSDGDVARGRPPFLIQLDPSLTGTGHVPTQTFQTSLPVGAILRDIAWHGAGFYGTAEVGGSYWLVDIDPTGRVSRVLSTALLSSANGIAWDGAFIYVTLAFTTVAFLQEWDPIAGVAMKSTTLQLGATAPGTTGPGILWDGAYFHTKVRGSIFTGRLDYQVNWPDPGGAVLQAVRTDTSGLASPSQAAEQLTLAWDGAFMWTIAEVTS